MNLVSALLALAPALLLLLALVRGSYPGERAIQRLRWREARLNRGVAKAVRPRPRQRPRRARRRAGELISGSLAGRAPPSSVGSHST